MTTPETERGGVLVVRVWFEPGRGAAGFRARITSTLDVEGDRQEMAAVTSPEAVTAAVSGWLARLIADGDTRPG